VLRATVIALILAWPATLRAEVVRARWDLKVFSGPRRNHDRGQVMKGARFTVFERRDGKGCQSPWVRIGERAWVCGTGTEPTTEAPGGPTGPEVPAGHTLPASYVVTHDAPVFATLDDAAAGRGRRKLPGLGGYLFEAEQTVGGVRYYKAGGGWVPETHAKRVDSIPFRGVQLPAEAAGKRLAFVGPVAAQPVDAVGAPLAGTAPIAAQTYLGEVGAPVKAGKKLLYPVASDRFLRAEDVRLLRFAPAPAGVAADEHWVDVDLDQQTLVGWEGNRPAYATLVSTAHTATPIGTFHIERKRPTARMQSRPFYRHKWDTDAPWVMSIAGRIAMHTAYWHTDYGTARSMGCVNLSPLDARWLWEFTSPALPPGWLRIEADSKDRPTLVRIRRSHG
jgi:hypothetical protein